VTVAGQPGRRAAVDHDDATRPLLPYIRRRTSPRLVQVTGQGRGPATDRRAIHAAADAAATSLPLPGLFPPHHRQQALIRGALRLRAPGRAHLGAVEDLRPLTVP